MKAERMERTVLAVLVVLLMMTGQATASPFTDCGVLVQGAECGLFQADGGGLYVLENWGDFHVGDCVCVSGILDPDCITICMQGDGCITDNTISPCQITTWTPDNVEIVPENPTSADVVDITFSGNWPDSCIPTGSNVRVDGSDIYFEVFEDTSGACWAVITPWEQTQSVGPLSPGRYTVYAALVNPMEAVIPQYTQVARFNVAETNTYVFVPGQSTLVKTGGPVWVHETYTIEGWFQLTFDIDANTASFDEVYGDLYHNGVPLDTTLDILLRMTEMISTSVSDTIIEFESNSLPGGITGELTLTFEEDNSVHLTGNFSQALQYPFNYELDAVARKKIVSDEVSWIPGQSSPADWSIDPNTPTICDVIHFSGPTAIFGNDCYGNQFMGGTPTLTIDPINKSIELWFQPPAPDVCYEICAPVCGLQGSFGPLEAGQWVFSGAIPWPGQEGDSFWIPFEVTGSIYYVDADVTGAGDGSSWADAYIYLQHALWEANSIGGPVEIRVAQGTYKPHEGVLYVPEFDERELTFQLINDVTIKGGYAGFGQPDPNARDIYVYETILSGDLDGNDVQVDPCELLDEPSRAENSIHVVTGSGTDAMAVLDGLTITAGNFNATCMTGLFCGGGGMYNWSGSPTLTNCTFRENSGRYGGGMCNEGDSSPTLINCVFRGNFAAYGGGIRNKGDGSPTLINCVFRGNFAASGGGIHNEQSSPTLSNCTFSGNSARYGGGMYNGKTCSVTLVNCTFAGNSAPNGNALACNSYLAPSNLQLTNCILWDGGNEVFNGDGSTITITYSSVEGGWIGLGNINADPLFADPCNGDYHLKSEGWRWSKYIVHGSHWWCDYVTSPCIDAGNPGSPLGNELLTIPDDPYHDWGVNLRINMGAYGGTAQASMPPYDWALLGDLSNDGTVDYEDLAGQLEDWLTIANQLPGDLNRDGVVNMADFALLAQDWLQMTDWANRPPEVYITSPEDGALVPYNTIDPIPVEADASDVDGSVVMVEFFANGNKIGEDNNAGDGWDAAWHPESDGAFSLTVTATDDGGAKTTSPVVEVEVGYVW